MNEQEKRNKAQEYRKQKKYQEAITLYHDLWINSSPKDKWDGWGYAHCLCQEKEYAYAYKISKEVYMIDPNFDYNSGVFAWSSFMSNIKNYSEEKPIEELEKFVKELIEVVSKKDNDKFRDQSILVLMDALLVKGHFNKVIEWSNKLNPNQLDNKAFDGVSKDGKKFRKPSDQESFYLKLTKALDKIGKYEECVKTCDEAINLFPNEVWFKWHKGSSLRHLKRYSEAISFLGNIINEKKEWFIYKELSASYYCLNDIDSAYKYFLEGCTRSFKIPTPENRWELYYIGAKILYKIKNNEFADQHLALIKKLREESGWKLQDFLVNDLDEHNISTDKSSKQIINELINFWISEQQKLTPSLNGIIKKIIQEGKAGFIHAENGKDYYFRVKNILSNKRITPEEGMKVFFNLQKSFDKKKNIESEEAVNVKSI